MNKSPFISVIMPVRNEAAHIGRSLRAVLGQDYPPDRIEIIVADGMSTDETRDIVHSFQVKFGNLQLVDNPRGIAPSGLNAGLRHALGEIIVRVDGHCEIAPDYVSRCVEHLTRENIGGVGGAIESIGETPVARMIATAMSSPFGVGGSAFRTVKGRSMFTDTVAFPAYKRSVIEKAGLFDEELVRNQDDEYNYRLRKLGVKILLASDVESRYYSRGTLRSLFRQYFQYGFWKIRVLQKHPHQMQWRQFVPFVFVLSLISLLSLTPFFKLAQWAFYVEAILYGIANLAASVLTARRSGLRTLPLLPIAFMALHLSYGFGFMVGLVKFRDRWRTEQFKKASPNLDTRRFPW